MKQKQVDLLSQVLNIQLQNAKNNQTPRIKSPHARVLSRQYNKAEIIEECLESVDTFRNIMMEDTLQRRKLVRDVMRNIEIEQHYADTLIYCKDDPAKQIFLVLEGVVVSCYEVSKEQEHKQEEEDSKSEQQAEQYQYEEVLTFGKGVGFGESEFITGKKREFYAIIKEDHSVIGKIDLSSFESIIQSYKIRTYYHKLNLFESCALFKELKPTKLEGIVNYAKPITYHLKQTLVKENTPSKYLYLISKGRVQLIKQINHSISETTKSKVSPSKSPRITIGMLEQGSFFGELELLWNTNYNYTAICRTEKVEAYYVDLRIIRKVLTAEDMELCKGLYFPKKEYYLKKLQAYEEVQQKVEQKQSEDVSAQLNPEQMIMKRKILARYVQLKPSLINRFSPRQISTMIERKRKRIKTDPNDTTNVYQGLMQLNSLQYKTKNMKFLAPITPHIGSNHTRSKTQSLLTQSPVSSDYRHSSPKIRMGQGIAKNLSELVDLPKFHPASTKKAVFVRKIKNNSKHFQHRNTELNKS